MSQNNKNQKEADGLSNLWKVAERLHGTGSDSDLETLLRAAKIPITWRDLYNFNIRYGHRESIIIPPYISDFISACISEKKPQSILDPWAGMGSLLLPIVEKNVIPISKGISPSQPAFEVARLMDKRSLVQWIQGSPRTALDELGKYDLIVSSPPIGYPPIAERFEHGGEIIQVRDSEPYTLVLRAATHLGENGEAIFILPNSLFFSAQSTSTKATLPKLGIHINSIIALPVPVFAHATSLELNLVFLSRYKSDDIFVGQLSPDRDPIPLIENMRNRRTGAAPELGRILKLQDYRGWRSLVTTEEKQRMVERSGLTPVLLADIAHGVHLADSRNKENPFEDHTNSVYLPLIGTSPAVTSLADFKIKPHNYAQLVLNPEKVYSEFLAAFFNSPLGRKTRDALLTGAFIPKINKTTLLEATVYLLPIEAQKRAVDVDREISELQLQLDQFHRELWNRPVDAAGFEKALSKLNRRDSLEAWLEALPFPLASILQRYNASMNPEQKVTHLLYFFEAATQFFGTLMMSAFHSDQQFFQAHKREWFEGGKDNPHSLARSAFGEWVVRCQHMAKTTRQLLSSQEKGDQDRCVALYKVSDREKISTIADKNLYAVLEKTSRYRNDWKGHSGIIAKKEHDHRLTLLQEELTRLRTIIGTVFEDWWLVRPGSNVYTAGLYHYDVNKLMGSHQIFREEKVETSTAMDANELFFFDITSRQPLQLLHFFRMLPVPESEDIACYFFNRLDKKDVRWVSYHFEGKAERTESDTSVLKLIEEVEQNNGE
jgi:hypothetical protein